ncbi:MAG TPA: TetR/AcrR family transcriptional regulator [Anaerolineaceae bacterium]|nr:TetR/AcrR family transcriptional regulator [Anaerolineaceae bacterium]HQH84319.1 TetR/AcrR family transcriptional regulator [Anaerolineaceae bacterium]
MDITDSIQPLIFQAEQDGLVQRTFRRLDPDRQQAVINAILTEAAISGPDQIRIQAVAERAGVAVGSLYQYFSDREHLLDFTVWLCSRAWEEMFSQYIPLLAAMPLRDGLRAYIQGGLELNETERGVVQFMGRAAYQGDRGRAQAAVDSVAHIMLSVTRQMLEQARLRGEIRKCLDIEATTRSVNAFLIALGDGQLFPYLNQYYQLTSEDMSFDRVLDAAIDLIVRGLE